MSAPPANDEPPPSPRTARSKAERTRLLAAGVLGVLLTAFAALNLEAVEVNWLLGSWSTPLIVVIAVSTLLGMALDRFLTRRSRRASR